MSAPLAMFGIGTTELMIIGGIMLLLFGSRLPSAMRNMGRGITEFKKGMQGIEEDDDAEHKQLRSEQKSAEA